MESNTARSVWKAMLGRSEIGTLCVFPSSFKTTGTYGRGGMGQRTIRLGRRVCDSPVGVCISMTGEQPHLHKALGRPFLLGAHSLEQ